MKKAKKIKFRKNSVFWDIFYLFLLLCIWCKIGMRIASGDLSLHNLSLEDILLFVGAIFLSLLFTVFNRYSIVVAPEKGTLTFYNGKQKKVTIPLCEIEKITISARGNNPVLPIIMTKSGKAYELDNWYVNISEGSYPSWKIKNIKSDLEHFTNKVNNVLDDMH